MSLKFNLVSEDLLSLSADAGLFFVTEQDDIGSDFDDISQVYLPKLAQLFLDQRFKGQRHKVLVLPCVTGTNLKYLIFAGLGKADHKLTIEEYRRVVAKVVRTAAHYNIHSLVGNVPDADLFGCDTAELIKQTVLIGIMADYSFDQFITGEKLNHELIYMLTGADFDKPDLAKKYQAALDVGVKIGLAVNQTRNWVDLPSNKLAPHDLANFAAEIAKAKGLGCTVFGEPEVKQMGMGGLAGVSAGAAADCKFVILEYKTSEPNAPTVAFVGKGIMFDSGGLSIKPALNMEQMKDDMSGAAAVISAMGVLADLKPKINIIGLAPLAENLPSGTATKPGDIVTFYNGKTAEVKNTDAEGRLVLADALSYAVKHYQPDAIIDLATLTGACAYSLGPFFSGLFSEHEELTAQVIKAANRSGDFVWRLPLTDDYKVAVKAKVADLCNIGAKQYQAGATTAACFLQHFVGNTPWVHLDIAGTAFGVPDLPYYRSESATGVGVRLLIELAMSWPNAQV